MLDPTLYRGSRPWKQVYRLLWVGQGVVCARSFVVARVTACCLYQVDNEREIISCDETVSNVGYLMAGQQYVARTNSVRPNITKSVFSNKHQIINNRQASYATSMPRHRRQSSGHGNRQAHESEFLTSKTPSQRNQQPRDNLNNHSKSPDNQIQAEK